MKGPVATHCAVVLLYLAVAVLFTWPLAGNLSSSFLGPPDSDLGVYVWNLWVFRHEIVVHGAFPFFTLEILSLSPRLPLTLQNYTTFSNVLAFGLLPAAGIVVTFNLLTIFNGIASAYAMFLYAARRTNDVAAASLAGLLFGFSPFMTARSVEHLSLTQAAPLPIFGLLMLRLSQNPSPQLSAAAGLVVTWAFLCDPYYAVYCLFILGFLIGYSVVTVNFRPEPLRREWWTTLLDLALLSVSGLILGILLRGGGQVELLGARISFVSLYAPVLALTVLATLRLWIALRPRLTWAGPKWGRGARLLVPGLVMLGLSFAPLLYPLLTAGSSAFPGPGAVPWRNSTPGLDALAYVLPNPFQPWLGDFSLEWFKRQPNGFTENIASIPITVIGTMVAATVMCRRWAHPGWIAFTVLFALLSLGPFIVIDGANTHVPGPWALLRYLPVVGAARMPTRLAILVLLGMSMMLAMAVQVLRSRSPWRQALPVAVGVLLLVEMMPGPRTLHSAEIPNIHRIIASDPRAVRVINLPFGLRDGLSSAGNASAEYQYHQTAHEKPLVGGYVSRLPSGEVERYRDLPVMSALLDLSEGKALTAEREREVLALTPARARWLNIGWVVVDGRKVSADLEQFAISAFDLVLVATDGSWRLYRSSLPPSPATMQRAPADKPTYTSRPIRLDESQKSSAP